MSNKMAATGYQHAGGYNPERPTVRAVIANGDNAEAIMIKADTIVASYNLRVDNQIKVIDRLMDGHSGQSEINRLHSIIQEKDVEIIHMRKEIERLEDAAL